MGEALENYYFKLIVPEYNIAKDATSPMLGKKHSEEAKAKMSAIKKGQTHSEETKAKISAGNKGKTYSNETIYKISVSKKGPAGAVRRLRAGRSPRKSSNVW